jgi:exopolysaccharide biosynthesis polyprenyl glycosylphosphotransferase
LLRRTGAEMVVLSIPSLSHERFAGTLAACAAAGVQFAFVPGQAVGSEFLTDHTEIDGLLLSSFAQPTQRRVYECAKRGFDMVAASLLLVLALPILAAIAILVRVDSEGPVLFRQKRVGREGKLFEMYKFRTMYTHLSGDAESPQSAADPRITPIGRFLRRSSMDELPQLLNVLKGDMSLVGPRPEMPFIVAEYSARDRQRLQVQPGITGLWQLSADRAFRIHENIQYDLYYIKNRSFFMDVAILLHTAVFAMRGV